ncbi:MAG: DUF4401 domain-containing protein [Flavobacteriaceae bacterium]|jgi:hypothetical protein|nr:DUF4401 domain-containing protein [Flavobacteriaceae bacterium]
MNSINNIQQLKDSLIAQERTIDEEKLATLNKKKPIKTILITILSVIGGLLGIASFIAFIALVTEAEEVENLILFFGVVFLIFSFVWSRKADSPSSEGLGISLYISGGLSIVLGLAFYYNSIDYNVLIIASLLIGLVGIVFFKSRIIAMLGMLTVLISLHCAAVNNDINELVYILLILSMYAIIAMYVFEIEIRIKSLYLSELYLPIRSALIIYTLGSSILCSTWKWMDYYSTYTTTLPIILCVAMSIALIYTLYEVFKILSIKSLIVKIGFIIISLSSFLIIGVYYPAFSIGLLIIFWAFKEFNLNGVVEGSLVFIWAMGLFYYDLTYTLLIKSVLLIAVGALLLIGFYINKKGGISNEIK